jgi:SAM-dependent methyltransferase
MKGYQKDEDYEKAYSYSPERRNQADDKPYPAIDPKSLEPIPNQDFIHDKEEFGWRNRYWNEHIGLQSDELSDSPRRAAARKALNEVRDAHPGKWADLGCGRAKFNPEAVGVDAWPYDGVDCTGDVFDPWFFNDSEFDGLAASHVVEHCKRPIKEALKAWDRILKPGGVLAIIVPDAENRPSTICEPSHNFAFTKGVLECLIGRVMGYRILKLDSLDGCPENKKDLICVAVKK